MENLKNTSLVKTFLGYTIPCILGMFLTSFITIVDGIFIGWKIGEKGLAAVNLTLPVLYVLLALNIMIGVGGVTIGAQCRGAGAQQEADKHFSFSLAVNLGINLFASLMLVIFLEPIIGGLRATGVMQGYVRDFLGTMGYFYPFMMINMTFSMFIRSEGKPALSLFFGVAGNLLNIMLDYLFIFRLDYGMRGAALASGISVLIPFACGLLYFLSGKSVYKFRRFQVNPAVLGKMLQFGSAEFVAQISVSITTFVLNWVLLRHVGIHGVAAITIVGYVSFIQGMILTGIAIGIHPVLSYCYGAGNHAYINNLMVLSIKIVSVVGVLIFLVSYAGSNRIAAIFAGGNAELGKLAADGLRLYTYSFLLNGFNVVATAYFTSVAEPVTAAVVSSLRSLVLIILFVMVLPGLIGIAGIWLTAPMTELVTFIVALVCYRRSKEKLLCNMG